MDYLACGGGKLLCSGKTIQLRGMGLGGWLLPEGYMWKLYGRCDRPRRMEDLLVDLCGSEYAASFWEAYFASYITEADIAWMAEQGINSVRLPLNARHLFAGDGVRNLRFNGKTLRYVDDCLSWCRKRGLYLILDMHGAPGGQTGQNIDDSEDDRPGLFIDGSNQELLVAMWRMLAQRYADEAAIGAYDLLNEPLPKWQKRYHSMLLPLYRRLIAAIREVDRRHVIVLEGLHWATDFSVFDAMSETEAANNIMLQFHKYWSDPDEESLAPYLSRAKRLAVPLWMGEGGENNCDWYSYAFPMYERLGIGWCFWSYKKMDGHNSPRSFAQPEGWEKVVAYIAGGEKPAAREARGIFDAFIAALKNADFNRNVLNALLRRPPLALPAAAYDAERILSPRRPGADFRLSSAASLIFSDGHSGPVDWRRYGGEEQPEDQALQLCLRAGDAVAYRVQAEQGSRLRLRVGFAGAGRLSVLGTEAGADGSFTVKLPDDQLVWLECLAEEAYVERVHIELEG